MYRKLFTARIVVIIASLLVFGVIGAQAQKMSAEEIISKHIESIGKSDVVANSKQRMAIGSSEFYMPRLTKTSHGRAVLASNGNDLAFFSTFEFREYSRERIGWFGNKISIPNVDQGHRSPLGSFLTRYDTFLTDHLFGGCVFSTWIFFQKEGFGGRLETEGKKKIGDRDVWVVKYSPKGGLKAGSYIRLYFDAENFHHLRTEYRQIETDQGFHDTSHARGDFSWDADMANNGIVLTEDFEDIREVAGLTLPHKYKIALRVDSYTGTTDFYWTFGIEEYRIMKEFPAEFFSFKG